jgi:hypothetical protein
VPHPRASIYFIPLSAVITSDIALPGRSCGMRELSGWLSPAHAPSWWAGALLASAALRQVSAHKGDDGAFLICVKHFVAVLRLRVSALHGSAVDALFTVHNLQTQPAQPPLLTQHAH